MLRTALLLAIITLPTFAIAAPQIAITTESFVETKVPVAGSAPKVVLKKIKSTAPGNRVVSVFTAHNGLSQAATNVVIDSKIDPNLAFDNTTDGIATLSVDGGKTFGQLTTAKVRRADGTEHAALPGDVTNIRWIVPVLSAGAERRVSYVAVVK